MGTMSLRSFDYAGIRHIVIDNLGEGSITVEGGVEADAVDGSIEAEDSLLADVQIRQAQDSLRISLPQRSWRRATVDLRLRVPDDLAFVIKTGAADVSFAVGIARSRLISGSGDISIGRAADLDCSTGSGNVQVSELVGRGARLSTGSGHLSIGSSSCPISAKSGSGHIDITSLNRADLQAGSGSGEVTVSSTTGSVDIRSASGSVSVGVADQLATWLDLSSVSGRVAIGMEAISQPEPGEPYISVRARTASGDIGVFRS
jgi:DUF4097 and DUF4098 domain-containing protein YvlB